MRQKRPVVWLPFERELTKVLARLEEDQFLAISVKGSNHYVQFAGQGSSGMRVETTSNAYLKKTEKLGKRQLAALAAAGWSAPTGTPEEATPERDPEGSPNHFVDVPAPIDPERVARLAVQTFADILRVSDPSMLEYCAFHDDRDIAFPELGLTIAGQQPPVAGPEVQADQSGGVRKTAAERDVPGIDYSDYPRAKLISKLRRAFHSTVTPLLVEDKSYSGPGRVYKVDDADIEEIMEEAITVAFGEDFEHPDEASPLDIFDQLTEKSRVILIDFEVDSRTSSDYGLNSCKFLGRGYIYFPGDPGADVPYRLLGAWTPAASQEAFEHAFIATYVALADRGPFFEPYGGYARISGVGVSPRLLAEAMRASLAALPEGWENVWTAVKAKPLASAEGLSENVQVPRDLAAAAIKGIAAKNNGFRESITAASPETQIAALGAYLHAMEVFDASSYEDEDEEEEEEDSEPTTAGRDAIQNLSQIPGISVSAKGDEFVVRCERIGVALQIHPDQVLRQQSVIDPFGNPALLVLLDVAGKPAQVVLSSSDLVFEPDESVRVGDLKGPPLRVAGMPPMVGYSEVLRDLEFFERNFRSESNIDRLVASAAMLRYFIAGAERVGIDCSELLARWQRLWSEI